MDEHDESGAWPGNRYSGDAQNVIQFQNLHGDLIIGSPKEAGAPPPPPPRAVIERQIKAMRDFVQAQMPEAAEALARRAADEVPLDDPAALAPLFRALSQHGFTVARGALAHRAAEHVSVDDPAALKPLVKALIINDETRAREVLNARITKPR